MNENEFLEKLRERAAEQEKIMRNVLFPKVFLKVILWFGDHPMKIILPISMFLTLIFRYVLGKGYYDTIFKVFGKL